MSLERGTSSYQNLEESAAGLAEKLHTLLTNPPLFFKDSTLKELLGKIKKHSSAEQKAIPTIDIASNDDGLTPLMIAASRGDKNSLLALINAGANLNLQQKQTGQTALMLAVINGRVDCANELINAKADREIQCTHNLTAFLYAAKRKDAQDLLALFVRYRGVLDSQTRPDGYSAVMIAAMNCRMENIKFLRQLEANCALITTRSETAADLAFSRALSAEATSLSYFDIVQVLRPEIIDSQAALDLVDQCDKKQLALFADFLKYQNDRSRAVLFCKAVVADRTGDTKQAINLYRQAKAKSEKPGFVANQIERRIAALTHAEYKQPSSTDAGENLFVLWGVKEPEAARSTSAQAPASTAPKLTHHSDES